MLPVGDMPVNEGLHPRNLTDLKRIYGTFK
jgi:hypothetical protein